MDREVAQRAWACPLGPPLRVGHGVVVVGNHHNRPAAFWTAGAGSANDDGDVGVERAVVAVAVEAGDVVDVDGGVDDVAGRDFAGIEHDVHVDLNPRAYLARGL